jgi:hypothetical protein
MMGLKKSQLLVTFIYIRRNKLKFVERRKTVFHLKYCFFTQFTALPNMTPGAAVPLPSPHLPTPPPPSP